MQKVLSLSLSPKFRLNQKRGFTLLEILLVVGIISILAGIVIVAINPSKQLATVRNAQRKSDIKQINNALLQYYIDEFEYPSSLDSVTELTEICDTGATSSPSGVTCTGMVDLSELVPTYITSIPVDPQGPELGFLDNIITKAFAAEGGTGYSILKTSTNKIGIQADRAELEQDIVIGMAASTTPTGEEEEEVSMPTGLVAHYKMNDTSGTAVVDTLGNNGTASVNITGLVEANGRIGGALSFDGSTQYITTSYKFYPNEGSYSFWVKTTSASAYSYILGDYAMISGYLVSGHLQTDSVNGLYGGGVGAATINDGDWHHVVITWNTSSGIIAYVDGQWDSEETRAFSMSTPAYNFQIARRLDAWGSGAGRGLNGKLDDIRIYSHALIGPAEGNDCTDEPDTEICQIWNDGAGTEAE